MAGPGSKPGPRTALGKRHLGKNLLQQTTLCQPSTEMEAFGLPADPQREQLEKPAKMPRRILVADHWRQIVANTDAISWKEDQEAKMDVALKRWFDIISQFPEIHETVKQLHLLAGLAEQLRMLRDILSGRLQPH